MVVTGRDHHAGPATEELGCSLLGSVVTWRRAQMVLLSAQGMDPAGIAKVTFTSVDQVRDVIHNFDADGFDFLRPKYAGGRPPKFDPAQRGEIKKIALSRPADHDLPFSPAPSATQGPGAGSLDPSWTRRSRTPCSDRVGAGR